ncbi:unnamed protein product [Zymoseptoria tritici ST99CH_3D1]|uniref:Extracellular membrane protein CFEM domain-containing protein n=1 Tax=Zymoseptoria tritici ST99CH_1E4 TaxID=1276532 RepID=A0A2H1G3Q4_ZYMTR|nr:unnamed protein product [Zymoseptoria tritici ST99CH_1E4]SMR49393.1 unnamed protein product [Zymoseptoria tritici ST99CH_3D1]
MRSTLLTLGLVAMSVSAQKDNGQKDDQKGAVPQWTTDNPNPACENDYNTCISNPSNRHDQCECLHQACQNNDSNGPSHCAQVLNLPASLAAGPLPNQYKPTSGISPIPNQPMPTTTAPNGDNIIVGTLGPAPGGGSPIAAPANSIPLGQPCSDDRQCAGQGVACFGQTSGTIPSCGSFNAPCQRDDQCAYNTCDQKIHLCAGFLPSQSQLANRPAATTGHVAGVPTGTPPGNGTPGGAPAPMTTTTVVRPELSGSLGPNYVPTANGTLVGTMTGPGGARATVSGIRGNATTSAKPGVSTGGASSMGVFSGVAAVGFGILAWVV